MGQQIPNDRPADAFSESIHPVIDTMEMRLHEFSLLQTTEGVVLTQIGPTFTSAATAGSSGSGGGEPAD